MGNGTLEVSPCRYSLKGNRSMPVVPHGADARDLTNRDAPRHRSTDYMVRRDIHEPMHRMRPLASGAYRPRLRRALILGGITNNDFTHIPKRFYSLLSLLGQWWHGELSRSLRFALRLHPARLTHTRPKVFRVLDQG